MEVNAMKIKSIESQDENKIQELENKINLLNDLNVGLKKKVDELENKEKIVKINEKEKENEKVKEKMNSSNKFIEEMNDNYNFIEQLDSKTNKTLPNLNLPKFKNKKFPPSKMKSKNLKKTYLNNSDNQFDGEKPLFELRSEGIKNYKNKKNSPPKLIIEKYERKRNNDKIPGDIYHNRSMKFLKPLKNSFVQIPQTNLNSGKKM